jgi:hypothetical protein
MTYNISKVKGNDEDSSSFSKVAESRGWWETGTSKERVKITSELP